MDENLLVLVGIRQDGRRTGGSGFLKLDLRLGQKSGLAQGHMGIRQPVFWCSSEEGLNHVMCCEYKTLTQR